MEQAAFHDTDKMTAAEIKISEEALRFARSYKKSIARRLTDKAIYPSEESPVSVLGAGKTEASVALINLFADTPILRIDPDELRNEFATYNGANSWLFQRGVSILVEKMIDNSGRLYKAGVDKIDYHIPEQHTWADLEAKLRPPSGAHW